MKKSVIFSVVFSGKISQLDEIVFRKPDKTWIIDGFGGFSLPFVGTVFATTRPRYYLGHWF